MTTLFMNLGGSSKNRKPKENIYDFSKYTKEAIINGATGVSKEPILNLFLADNQKELDIELAPLTKILIQTQAKKVQAQENLIDFKKEKNFFVNLNTQKYTSENAETVLDLNNQATINREDIKRLNSQLILLDMDKEKHKRPSKIKIRVLYFIVAASYVGFEIPTLTKCFEAIYYTDYYKAVIIAGAVSFLGLTASHFLGKSWHDKNRLHAAFWLATGLVINGITISLRYDTEVELTVVNTAIGALLLTTFFINSFLSKSIHFDSEVLKIFNDYDKIDKEINQKNENVIITESKAKHVEKNATSNAEQKYNEALLNYQKTIDTYQQEEKVIENTIKEVKTKFKDREKLGKVEITKAYKKGKRKNRNSFKATCIALLLISSIFFASCEQKKAKTINIGLAVDCSLSQQKDTLNKAKIFKFIFEELQIDTVGFMNNGFEIKLTSIGWASNPEVITVKLPPVEGSAFFNNRLKRKEEVKTFIKNLKVAITQIASISKTQEKTNIWLPILAMLQQFDSNADRKQLYIISDYISDNHLISLDAKEYRKKPEKILQDYEELSTKLLKTATLSEDKIENLEIILVKRVQNQQDEQLAYFSTKFFEKIFKMQGIEVSVRGQL